MSDRTWTMLAVVGEAGALIALVVLAILLAATK